MPITTTPSGGPQGEFNTYTPISVQTLTTSASSITFSNLPTTFTDLVIVSAPVFSSQGQMITQFNGDTGSSYSITYLIGDGGTPGSTRYANQTAIGTTPTQISTSRTHVTQHIQNYSNATTFKTMLQRTGKTTENTWALVGTWRNTAPITSVTLTGSSANFASGSTFTVYGIAAAAPAPKATGGDAVYTDNTYWYHVFNTAGTLDVRQTITADFLVVGGGGGGGFAYLGGGGAGGYRTSVGTSGRGAAAESQLSLTVRQYSVLVGGGGAPNLKGTDSSLHTITSLAGGAGDTKNGGSGAGGGASTISPSPGSGTAGQGYDGGTGVNDNNNCSGGGGAGGNGGVANGSGGAGGVGVTSSISGFSVGYAGGGGGGGGTGSAGSASHGGGAGSVGGSATSGTTNRGGGGGSSYVGVGSNGGSGVVIVRYAV
jgi:hypothetical protein